MKRRIKKAKNGIKEFFKNFYKALRKPEMVVLPGNLAFFFVLAIIPSLALISYGASILNLSTDYLYNFMAQSFSKEIADLILGVHFNSDMSIQFIITLIVGFYVASNGAHSIINSTNAIYGFENKSWWKRRLKAFGMTFLIVILLIFMLIVPVFGNTIIDLIKEVNLNANITKRIVEIFAMIKGPTSWIIMFIIIRVIYAIAPNEKPHNRVINYGAWFTSICFILVTKLYSLYVNNFSAYTVLYGGLANIVVLMIWVFFLSYIFTIGIALNYQKDEDNLLKTGTIKIEK